MFPAGDQTVDSGLSMDAEYECGWCGDRCTLQKQCPTGNWLDRTATCPGPQILRVSSFPVWGMDGEFCFGEFLLPYSWARSLGFTILDEIVVYVTFFFNPDIPFFREFGSMCLSLYICLFVSLSLREFLFYFPSHSQLFFLFVPLRSHAWFSRMLKL